MSIETGFPEKQEAKMDLERFYRKYLCNLKVQSPELLIWNCYDCGLPGKKVIENVKIVISEVKRK